MPQMNRKLVKYGLWCLACLAVSLLGGLAFVKYLEAKRTSVAARLFIETGEAGKRTSAAYRHGTQAEGISALSAYLAQLEKAKGLQGYDLWTPRWITRTDMALTHARLAKLYESSGQPSLSTQHVALALECAKSSGHLAAITNWESMARFVAEIDTHARD